MLATELQTACPQFARRGGTVAPPAPAPRIPNRSNRESLRAHRHREGDSRARAIPRFLTSRSAYRLEMSDHVSRCRTTRAAGAGAWVRLGQCGKHRRHSPKRRTRSSGAAGAGTQRPPESLSSTRRIHGRLAMSDKQRIIELIRALSGLNEEYLKAVAAGIRSGGHRLREEEQTVTSRSDQPVAAAAAGSGIRLPGRL